MIYKLKAEKTYFNLDFGIELEKDKQVYCFIGENGVGKTKLLETMCVGMISGHNLLKGNSELFDFHNNSNISDELMNNKLRVPETLELNEKPIDKFTHSKIIKFIGAKDRGFNVNYDKDKIKMIGTNVERFNKNFLETFKSIKNEKIEETSAADWFVSRLISNTGMVVGGETYFNELVLLCNILSELDPKTFGDLIQTDIRDGNVGRKFKVYINAGKLYFNEVPFESLPSGYMGIIKIVQDIIDTYGSWDIKNTKSYERKAVFFIDEIEAHLHPRWESRVIPLLKKFFPQAIFYITTHSPTVVGSTQEGEAYELVNFDGVIKAKKLGDPRSWYLADVYSQAFHLEDFLEKREEDKKEVRDEFKIFSNLVKSYLKTKNQEKLKEGLELAQRLEANLSTDDPRLMTLNNLKSLLQ